MSLARKPLLIYGCGRRSLSAQAKAVASSPQAQPQKAETKVSALENGVTAVSSTTRSPASTVSVVVRSGPRHETYDNAGVAHALRVAAGMASKNHSFFSLTKNIQQAGSALICTQGREHTAYTVHALPEKIDDVMDYFLDAVCQQAFKPWEVNDNVANRLRIDLEDRDPQAELADLLHKAAYRTGLGNPIFTPEYMVGKHKPTLLQAFFNQTFTSRRTAIVGLNVDQGTLARYANQMQLEGGSGPADQAQYFGGEQRKDAGGKTAYVSIAAECAGAGTNLKEAIAALLLQRVLGNGSQVKWGTGSGKLQKAVADSGAKATAFSFTYSDSGLVGANIVADANSAGKAVSAAAAAIRSLSVSEAELAAAKANLLQDAYGLLTQNQLTVAEDLGMQALVLKDGINTPEKLPGLVGGVAIGDVQAVAKKISSSKLSLASYGNLGSVPYLDSL